MKGEVGGEEGNAQGRQVGMGRLEGRLGRWVLGWVRLRGLRMMWGLWMERRGGGIGC